jgi:serine/threonine protein kinase
MNSIISNIECPYIVRPIEIRPWVVRGRSTHLLFMPYYADGDLITEVLRNPEGMSEPVIRHYGRQMLLAVQALHCCNVVHADVKPDNFYLKESASGAREIALGDFGMSLVLEDDGLFPRNGDIGTEHFLPPEFFRHDVTRVGRPMDLWAMGVTFYIMATGAFPFDLRSIQAPLDVDPPFPLMGTEELAFVSDHFADLIKGLLQVDQDRRLTVDQALNHRFFEGQLEVVSVKATAKRICHPGDDSLFSDDTAQT